MQVYALINRNRRIYVGQTHNLSRRVEDHNQGRVPSTKFYRPWKLLYSEKVSNRAIARIREKYFKHGIGKEFLKKCQCSSVGRARPW